VHHKPLARHKASSSLFVHLLICLTLRFFVCPFLLLPLSTCTEEVLEIAIDSIVCIELINVHLHARTHTHTHRYPFIEAPS
jgi:hypothetical protein